MELLWNYLSVLYIITPKIIDMGKIVKYNNPINNSIERGYDYEKRWKSDSRFYDNNTT